MHDGRAPSSAAVTAVWEDSTRHVALNSPCYWWECADIKIDAPPAWQLQPSEANYFHFETRLIHENPDKGNLNRVYVQVHNRGPLAATDITVKIMVAGASAGLPDLPADFWTAWPNSAGDANWTQVGVPQTIASLEALRPAVLRWDWTPDPNADAHSCMLVALDSPSDPVPASSKAIFNIAQLVTVEKRVGLKNLHVVNVLPNAIKPPRMYLHGSRSFGSSYRLRIPALVHPKLRMNLLLSKRIAGMLDAAGLPSGLRASQLPRADLGTLKRHALTEEMRTEQWWEQFLETYEVSRQYSIATRAGAELPIVIEAGAREEIVFLIRSGQIEPTNPAPLASFAVEQTTERGELVGGSTFVFKPRMPI